MSTRGSAANLGEALKQLSRDWDDTKTYWRDVKSEEFERTYLSELPQQIARVLTVMEELDTLLRKVRNDCE